MKAADGFDPVLLGGGFATHHGPLPRQFLPTISYFVLAQGCGASCRPVAQVTPHQGSPGVAAPGPPV